MKRARSLRFPTLVLTGACLLGLAALPEQALGREGEAIMIQVRGRTQLRLREGERKPTDEGLYDLSLQVQLDDGQDHTAPATDSAASGEAALRALGDPQAAGLAAGLQDPAAETSSSEDPTRSFASQVVRLRIYGPGGGPGGELPAPPAKKTGMDGRATFALSELLTGRYTFVAEYAGDDWRDAARTELVIDLGRQPVFLGLAVPPRILHTGELQIGLALLSQGHGFTGPIQLSVGDEKRTVQVRNGFGQTRVPLRGRPWASKGSTLAVIASFAGDLQRGSALQRRDVLLMSQSHVSLELAATGSGHRAAALGEVAQGSPLAVTGTVVDEDGPLGDQPVDLEVSEQPGGERQVEGQSELPSDRLPVAASPRPDSEPTRRAVASGVTDHNGRFRIVIPRLPLHPGPAVLAAQVLPRQRYILPARAAELPIVVLPPEPVSALYYLLPLCGSALLGLLWVLLRWLRPHVLRLFAALRERRQKAAPPPPAASLAQSSAASQSVEVSTGEPGVKLAQSRRLPGLTLRRTVDTAIDGQILDASFGRPVPAGVVTLQLLATGVSGEPLARPGTERVIRCNADGHFSTGELGAGRYVVEVGAPGYLPQRFAATVPHRGELRGVSVRLEPIRVRLLGEWRRVAERLLGQESRLRTATPRELLDQVSRLRGATAANYGATVRELRRLTDLVEQAYYSPRICTAEMLASATQLADAILAGTASAGMAPALPPQQKPGQPMPLS